MYFNLRGTWKNSRKHLTQIFIRETVKNSAIKKLSLYNP